MKILSDTAITINTLWRSQTKYEVLSQILLRKSEDLDDTFEDWLKEECILIPKTAINQLIAQAQVKKFQQIEL